MAINSGKVVTGGLLAGFVFNAFDMVSNYVLLADEMKEMIDRLHLDPANLTDVSKAAPWIVFDFLLGLLVVWTYAAIRPRFGPGVRTAILAGMVPYVAITGILWGFTEMGVFTSAMFMKGSALSLLNMGVGSIAGAWAYKET